MAPPSNPRRSSGILATTAKYWRLFNQKTYAGDYLGLLLLALSNASLFLVPPFHRMFTLDDPRIQFPHADNEHVPVSLLLILAVAVPLGSVLAWAGVLRKGTMFLQVSVLGLGNSLLTASFLTDLVKQGVGRPRPDFLSRCKPKEGTSLHDLVTIEVCTETLHHILQDGWRSFPSGHSSTAFGGLFYLSLFFAGQLYVFRPGADLTRGCFAFSATILALFIAMSRLQDYRHDYADVLVGSLIGILTSYLSYRRYFPPLTSRKCNEPYKVPSEGSGEDYESLNEEDEGLSRTGDIEMGMVER